MRESTKIYLFDFIFQLSTALDLVDKDFFWHHPKVAYISYLIGREYGLSEENLNLLVYSALIHDIGVFSLEEKERLTKYDISGDEKHAFVGSKLLEISKNFSEQEKIIKYHHHDWDHGHGSTHQGDIVPKLANIIYIADRIEVLIDKDKEVKNQISFIENTINATYKNKFNPEIRTSVFKILHSEQFYKYINSFTIYDILAKRFNTSENLIGLKEIVFISRLFSFAIDFRVPFTYAHSNLVADLARKMGEILKLDKTTIIKLYISGLLHDIGKFSIPAKILNKKNELEEGEFNVVKLHPWYTNIILKEIDNFEEITIWASHHHERLDGTGYPFSKNAEQLCDESMIIATCDIFATLNEDRSFRSKKTKEEIIEIFTNLKTNNKLPQKFLNIYLNNIDTFIKYCYKIRQKLKEKYEYCLNN